MALSSRIDIGKFRHRIRIVKPYGAGQDTDGGLALTVTSPVVTLWANVEAVTASDALVDDSFVSRVTHKISIRYRGPRQTMPITIAANDQILFAGRVFQVIGVMNPDERTKKLVIMCVEINDGTQMGVVVPSGLL